MDTNLPPPPCIRQAPDVSLTLAQREAQHGDYRETSRIIQNLKLAAADSPNWENLAPFQAESIEIILHKIGRILSGNPNHLDHWHDIQGYAKLVENLLDRNAPD